mmetsp:Transcript_2382/g.6668  ORF Transcript_2382/g.6668 Transcript_2382/m.6668 type:complete len:397 (-) Transcript_2382:175-1365(-)
MQSALGPCGLAPGEAADLALLSVILWTAPPKNWVTLNRSWHRLRPRFSALAVDTWNRDVNTSSAAARRTVYMQHASILSLFDRVLFVSTGSKLSVSHAVRPSITYRRLWHATFGDTELDSWTPHNPVEVDQHGDLRSGQVLHGDGLPTLLIGLDADREVPDMLPLSEIAEMLDASFRARHRDPVARVKDRHMRRTRAEQIWVGGNATPCAVDAPGSLCHGPTASAFPVFVSPPVGLFMEDELCGYPAARQMPPGASGGCQRVRAPDSLLPAVSQTPMWRAFLYRGPFCPSSQFFIFHRNDLNFVLSSFEFWRQSFRANENHGKWHKNVVRWESTTCSLMGSDEAVLAPRFLWANKPQPPRIWMHSTCPKIAMAIRARRQRTGNFSLPQLLPSLPPD